MEHTIENAGKKIIIKTRYYDVEVNRTQHRRPGLCPYCHEPTSLYSVIFKKLYEADTKIYTGIAIAQKFGITIEANVKTSQSRIGECQYCHRLIFFREVVFNKTDSKDAME